MWDYLFEVVDEDSELCGETFFVECSNLHTAWEIAVDNFNGIELECIGKYAPEEAEILGYDTY